MKITKKMASFAEEYVKNGYNGAKAYRQAYDQDSKTVSASESYKLLRDPRILEEIENVEGSFRVLGQMAGIDKKAVVNALSKMIHATKVDKMGNESTDFTAMKDGITLFMKLTGDFKEKKEIKITNEDNLTKYDPTKMSEEDKAQLEKELLDEL